VSAPVVRRRAPRAWLVPTALALACAGAPAAARATTAADSIRYAVQVTDVNRAGLTVSNYGFFGNNFISRAPSFEFPLGAGYEHMSRGGLWIGARAIADTGEFIGVSTAIVDAAQGTNGAAETEFTPAGTGFDRRSRILNSPVYSPLAVSDQDLTCAYSDEPGRPPAGNSTERHTPLDILVRQRMLGFSLVAADAFEVAQFTIVNIGHAPLRDVWVGLYAQLVSGNKNAYPTWPPSATEAPGSWYYKTHAEYDVARRLYEEHYCLNAPYPQNCNFGYCPPWAAIQLLGVHPDSIAGRSVNFHWWSYSPGDTLRDTDVKRYRLLSDTTLGDPSGCVPGTNCSPIALLSVGPFVELDPGDSLRVDFAFVGGETQDSLKLHADYAQFASDIGYQLPQPPPSPRLRVETGERRVDLWWDDSPEHAPDPTSPAPGHLDFEGYRVYLGPDRQHPTEVAQFDLEDTTGFNTGLAPIRAAAPRLVDGVLYRYHYAIPALRDGFEYWGAVTSYDIGDASVPSLESGIGQNKFVAVPNPAPGERRGGVSVYPNPYRVEATWDQGRNVRDHYLWFTNLPPRARVRIYTLSGDLVKEQDFDGATYQGEGARGLYDPRRDLDTGPPAMSGASWAWDLVTREGQATATGLYLYSVEDLASGRIERGKFLIVKSDRE
jgi:hypothetical protein